MAIPLNQELLHRLIEQRFGSVDELVVEWEERVASGVQRFGHARDRSTIYRWIERGLPRKRDDIFGLTGVLDIDPVAILDLSIEYIERVLPRERRLLQLGQATQSFFAPFWPIFTPGPAWPDNEVAENFYGRTWSAQEFVHDLSETTGDYAAVYLETTAELTFSEPRTYHFAYRRLGARDQMWRPYGSVVGFKDKVRLISESGDFQEVLDGRSSECVVVDTYFGTGSAEFRVASIHVFKVHVNVPSTDKNCVRFVG